MTPILQAREEAARRLRDHFERVDQKTNDIPDKEMEELLREALRNVHPGYHERE